MHIWEEDRYSEMTSEGADHENAIDRCAVMSSRGENLPACVEESERKKTEEFRGDYYEKDKSGKARRCCF